MEMRGARVVVVVVTPGPSAPAHVDELEVIRTRLTVQGAVTRSTLRVWGHRDVVRRNVCLEGSTQGLRRPSVRSEVREILSSRTQGDRYPILHFSLPKIRKHEMNDKLDPVPRMRETQT